VNQGCSDTKKNHIRELWQGDNRQIKKSNYHSKFIKSIVLIIILVCTLTGGEMWKQKLKLKNVEEQSLLHGRWEMRFSLSIASFDQGIKDQLSNMNLVA